MEEFLTVNELSERIKLAKPTIYNLIYKKIFILNRHYYKPMPKKNVFMWSAVKLWLQGENANDDEAITKQFEIEHDSKFHPSQRQPTNLINI